MNPPGLRVLWQRRNSYVSVNRRARAFYFGFREFTGHGLRFGGTVRW